MATDLPTAAQMIDIDNAIKGLIIAIIFGAAGTITTGTVIMKWYLPAIFKRRDEQRKIENDGLQKQLENKNAAVAVDIERERMFPQMMENNQRLVDSMLQSNKANTDAIVQRIQQDKADAAALEANTKQLTTAAARLEETTEKLEAVEKKVDRLHDKFTKTFPREKSIDELFVEFKEAVAGAKQVVDERREHDSRPIPMIEAPKEPPPDELKAG